MGFNSAFKGLNYHFTVSTKSVYVCVVSILRRACGPVVTFPSLLLKHLKPA